VDLAPKNKKCEPASSTSDLWILPQIVDLTSNIQESKQQVPQVTNGFFPQLVDLASNVQESKQ